MTYMTNEERLDLTEHRLCGFVTEAAMAYYWGIQHKESFNDVLPKLHKMLEACGDLAEFLGEGQDGQAL